MIAHLQPQSRAPRESAWSCARKVDVISQCIISTDCLEKLTRVRSEEAKTTKGHAVRHVALFPRSRGISSHYVSRSKVRGMQPAANDDNLGAVTDVGEG